MSYKVLRNIEMDLSASSINNAIKQVKEVQAELQRKCLDLVRELATKGMEIAKMQVVSLDAVDTGDLERSIEALFFPEKRCGYVVAGVPYAVYVEYGTGVVGAATPHPGIGEGADGTVVSQHGRSSHAHLGYGQTFAGTADGSTKSTDSNLGWVYMDRHGLFHWTRGYPSRPFMYNTLKMLEELAPDMAGDLFAQM